MAAEEILKEISQYFFHIAFLEALGLIFGLLAVLFLIKENIWTWPAGILYVLVSFVIFIKERLYGDFALHVFFLVLNLYGWYYWIYGKKRDEKEVSVTLCSLRLSLTAFLISMAGILLFGFFLDHIHLLFTHLPPSSLPYWDAATSVLSITGMWLTARKKLENWYYWFVVDVMATGIYCYKGIYFYSTLYLIYVGMAVAGYLAWRKSMKMATV